MLQLMEWVVSGKNLFQGTIRAECLACCLFHTPKEKAQSIITSWPGESDLACVMNELLNHSM